MSEEQTDSAIKDKVMQFISNDDTLSKMVYSFQMYPNGTFLFDPTKDPDFQEYWLKEPKRFASVVWSAVVNLLATWTNIKPETAYRKYQQIKIRMTDSMRIKFSQWGPEYQNTPVAVEAMIISMEQEKTYTKAAEAVCDGCANRSVLRIEAYSHKLQSPPRCMNEKCPRFEQEMDIDPKSLRTGLYRIVIIQEPMDEAKFGNPRTFKCELNDDDVPQIYIGKRKRLLATFTSYFEKREAVQEILIKCLAVNDADDSNRLKVTEEEIAEFLEWTKREDFEEFLCESFAPEIFGEFLAKFTTIITIAGGDRIDRLRGLINALLIGPPSTGKSKILGYIVFVLEPSAYVNGATASGAGITIAYDDKIKAPRAGAVVICNGGLVAIDEFTRLGKEDFDKLLQAMEDGKIKYDKGGFTFPADAETAIIGGANPKKDFYDPVLTIVDNINLPPPIITRMDMMVNMIQNDTSINVDKKLKHIDEFRDLGEDKFIAKHKLLTKAKLLKYFIYIRKLNPKMTPEATEIRQKFFKDILEIQQKQGSIPIDARFYEGLYRVSTAIARIYMSPVVTKEHMQRAINHQKACLRTFGMEVEKGETQMNLHQTATNKEDALVHCFREVQAKYQEEYVPDDDVVHEMVKKYPTFFPSEDKAWQMFNHLASDEVKKILKHKGKYTLSVG